MLELATLGLLQHSPLHGYRLKQQLEMFMSGCISVNYGAIYPLLKRLEEQGLICITEEIDNATGNSSRKVYSITEQGKARWKRRMLEHPHESWVHSRSRFTIKYFFFTHIEPEERLKLLEHRLMVCRLRLESQDLPDLLPDPYQAMTLQRCTATIENEIEWLYRQIELEKTLAAKIYI